MQADHSETDDAPVRIERDGAVARLVLNRPKAGNAIGLSLASALHRAAITVGDDPDVRCVVMTGAGRLFCAGGDLSEIMGAGEGRASHLSALVGTLNLAVARLAAMEKPLLCIVNGPAAGAGMSLAIAGDVVIAAQSAHFTAAYGAIGLTPDGGMSWTLPRLVGLRAAQRIVFENRRIGADEAAAIGLVTEAVADDELAEVAAARAQALADAPSRAWGAARGLLYAGMQNDLSTQLELELRSIAQAGAGAEASEGIGAFMEKRKADYRSV
ncbi:enoyl-CoA hydratase-related protein [uncultured Croceicoccus sp.]|uniref:enoyl-CoA hydratase/isomerase family protein n=1 Tax=uncultured Croceicoccus sp. TaxID=1295329 RepID=UPI002608CEAF|nr:enoyl-CoA hydratase-related protein [uncultured Croceicoccus sp.]